MNNLKPYMLAGSIYSTVLAEALVTPPAPWLNVIGFAPSADEFLEACKPINTTKVRDVIVDVHGHLSSSAYVLTTMLPTPNETTIYIVDNHKVDHIARLNGDVVVVEEMKVGSEIVPLNDPREVAVTDVDNA